MLVRIADADGDVEEVGAVGQPQVDLEGQVAQPLPLPQAQHLAAVGRGDARGVQGAQERVVWPVAPMFHSMPPEYQAPLRAKSAGWNTGLR